MKRQTCLYISGLNYIGRVLLYHAQNGASIGHAVIFLQPTDCRQRHKNVSFDAASHSTHISAADTTYRKCIYTFLWIGTYSPLCDTHLTHPADAALRIRAASPAGSPSARRVRPRSRLACPIRSDVSPTLHQVPSGSRSVHKLRDTKMLQARLGITRLLRARLTT